MSVYAVSADIWALSEENDRRFRRWLTLIGVPVLLVAFVIPFLELHGLQRGGGLAGQAQYVDFIEEPAAPVEEVAEEPEPAEETEPEPEPEAEPETEEAVAETPVAEPVPTEPDTVTKTREARERAQQSGVLAFSDALEDLRSPTRSGVDAAQPLAQGSLETSKRRDRSSSQASEQIAQSAARSSGGVAATQVQRREAGTGIGERRTTTVEKPKGFGENTAPQVGQGGDKLFQGRSIDEIQLVMDRNSSAFYKIYNRALRTNAYLQGTISVSITIAPSGQVTDCKVVSSTMGDPEFEEKIVRRIMLINFGAKDVPTMTIPSYPLHFHELG